MFITYCIPATGTTVVTNMSILRLRKNCCHFADDNFKCVFGNEKIWILLMFPLKCVPKVPIDNNSALVQIMTWRQPGDKPLSGPIMVSWRTHIFVTPPQWVNIILDVNTNTMHSKSHSLLQCTHRRHPKTYHGSLSVGILRYLIASPISTFVVVELYAISFNIGIWETRLDPCQDYC